MIALNYDVEMMRLALRLARRGTGRTSPNPMVGAVLVRGGVILGAGWHRGAGKPHAEIEAIRAAQSAGHLVRGSTLYVTLEPCSTFGRTPPCTNAIIDSKIRKVVVAAEDPNPQHCGHGFELLARAGVIVKTGVLAAESAGLNAAFNHWIMHRTPLVTVKAAMSLDGRIATRTGESKWITGEQARREAMKLRAAADGILVGVNTIIADDPALTVRLSGFANKKLRRIILDPSGRTPLTARALNDPASQTTIVLTAKATASRRAALEKKATVILAPARNGRIDLKWLLKKLGAQNVVSLLVEGGGETNAQFLLQRLAHRIAFFYAPLVIGGQNASRAVAGDGILRLDSSLSLRETRWCRVGQDLLLTAEVA